MNSMERIQSPRVSKRFQTVSVATLLLVCLVGCSKPKNELSIVIAGDTQGWITPCGCAANQSGGLARRATLVTSLSEHSEVLLLDVGGSAVGTTDYQRVKFSSLLDGLNKMGLVAMNIGGSETAFAPDDLRAIGEKTGTKWVSCNLVDQQSAPITEPLVEITRAGIDIAITGVIDPALIEHNDWQATDALPAILKAFENCQADVKIVLAYFDEEGLRELAGSLPDVDYIVGGPTGQSIRPTKVGATTIASTTNKGKFLARIDLLRTADGVEQQVAKIIEVSSHLKEDKTQQENLKNYYAELKRRDFSASEAGLVDEWVTATAGYEIAGSATCVKCHQRDDQVWHDSKHAHAWDVLVAKGASFDPHCQQCHTTGYGLPSGFSSVGQTPQSVNVGCENCHGPSKAHVDNPKTSTPFRATQQCLRCHDHENSPEFEFDPYWGRVFHGKFPSEEKER